MLAAFYVALQRVLQLVGLLWRSGEFEIVVLRHEFAVLRRQMRRPELQPADRVFSDGGEPIAATRQVVVVCGHFWTGTGVWSRIGGRTHAVRVVRRSAARFEP